MTRPLVQRLPASIPAQQQSRSAQKRVLGMLKSHANHVHFIGIAGTGMLPLAVLAARQGMKVSGWDDHQTSACAALQVAGIDTALSLADLVMPDTIVVSAAIDYDHSELKLARRKGVPVIPRQQWFTQALSNYCQVAVSGSHGKTTTTALSAFLLHQLDHHVPFVCGGEIQQLPVSAVAQPAHLGSDKLEPLVIEADEFRQAFLGLDPMIAVLTNVDHEHIDCYPTILHLDAAFERFLTNMQPGGLLIACKDDPGSWRVVQGMIATGRLHRWSGFFRGGKEQQASCKWVITYGCKTDCDVEVKDIASPGYPGRSPTAYKLTWKGFASEHVGAICCDFGVQLAGHHNLMNATAAVLAATVCAVMQTTPCSTAAQALSTGDAFTLNMLRSAASCMPDQLAALCQVLSSCHCLKDGLITKHHCFEKLVWLFVVAIHLPVGTAHRHGHAAWVLTYWTGKCKKSSLIRTACCDSHSSLPCQALVLVFCPDLLAGRVVWGACVEEIVVKDNPHAGRECLRETLEQVALHTHAFAGTKRRMQLLCSCSGANFVQRLCIHPHHEDSMREPSYGGTVYVYDDYAHHPTEIAATLSAVHENHASAAVIAVWQPISRGRLSAFMHQFCTALGSTAGVIIAPMDTSRETADDEADARLVREALTRLNKSKMCKVEQSDRAFIAHTLEDMRQSVYSCACCTWQGCPSTEIAVVFMGSGNITNSARALSEILS